MGEGIVNGICGQSHAEHPLFNDIFYHNCNDCREHRIFAYFHEVVVSPTTIIHVMKTVKIFIFWCPKSLGPKNE